MGYETKLIIGKQSKYGSKEPKWFDVYAELDLCKCGYDSNMYKMDSKHKGEKPLVFWYAWDGNTHITKDKYDEMPKPILIKEVIRALEKDIGEETYRRFSWALALLKEMDSSNEKENIEVLLLGH